MGRNLRHSLGKQAARARQRFLTVLSGGEARIVQDEFLRDVLRKNCHTEFGREHNFDQLVTLDDYRAAVPIRHYEELAPWIERSAGGRRGVLTAEEPVRFWKTTGTTSEAKKIPVTPSSASKTMESFLTLQGTQLHFYPEVNERPDSTLVTHLSPKSVKEYLGPEKIPYCSTTEVPVEIREGREHLLPPWMPGLQDVVEDDSIRLYYMLCHAAAHDLLCVACLHPSRFRTVVSTLAEHGERIVNELRQGTVLDKPCRRPLPEIAGTLSEILRERGRLLPVDLWPNLSFITSWSGSYISRYRELMEECYCSGFLAMPSISSEAFTTMTVDDDPIGQPLNVPATLFEFIPSDQEVSPDSPTLQFHQLARGAAYELVITTLGGLYRYATCDIFRVIGFVGEVPRLEYVGRRSVSDLTGEKLAEEQVLKAVPAGLCAGGIEESGYTLCAVSEEQPRYVLVVEFEGAEEQCRSLARDLDSRFKAMNSRYELKRNFGDLHPLEVVRVEPGTFSRFREKRIQSGLPAGQFKDRALYPEGTAVLAELSKLSVRRVD